VKIELPASKLGAEGTVQLRIPRAMWGAIPPKVTEVPKEPVEPEPPEVPKYAAQLKSKLLADRRNAVLKLGELGPKAASAATALAVVMRKDTSETVRVAAAEAIGKIGPKARAVIPQLIEALEKDEFFMVKAAAAESLGLMGAEAKQALPALQQALTSKEEKVPAAAKEAIQRIDPQLAPK
jgi:HEAT repeat protein